MGAIETADIYPFSIDQCDKDYRKIDKVSAIGFAPNEETSYIVQPNLEFFFGHSL